jgi:hypothetical protein
MEEHESLSHTRWECKYAVPFATLAFDIGLGAAHVKNVHTVQPLEGIL